MEHYDVIITPDAEADLNELDDYITYVLSAPSTALAYINSIKDKLSSLEKAPKQCRPVDDEPWHSRGVRRMNARGFAAFYIILEDYKEVYIQNIIYQKRDLPKVLRQLYPDDF